MTYKLEYICTHKKGHLWHKANQIWMALVQFMAGINKLAVMLKTDIVHYNRQRNKTEKMETKVKISTTFNCSLERAFKSPMLCDVTKVHTGYGMMPRVTHCTEDEKWGQIGSSKKVFVEKSMTHKGGFGSVDNVEERIENKYWKIEINQFQAWMLSFYKFVGEWQTTELEKNEILVEYTYTLYSNNILLYPVNWIFTKTFWKKYMKQALENVRQITIDKEPYLYA